MSEPLVKRWRRALIGATLTAEKHSFPIYVDHLPVDDARSRGRLGSGSWHHVAGASMSRSVQSTASDERLASAADRACSVEHPARMASANAAAVRIVLVAERMAGAR